VTELKLDAKAICRLIGETWYRFDYATRDPNEIAEVVRFHENKPKRNLEHGLAAPGDRRIIRYRDLPAGNARYLVRRRQCTRQELAEIEG